MNPSRIVPRGVGVLLLVAAVSGCQTEIEHGLNEGDANNIVVVLERASIPSVKEREEGGREVTWAVAVPRGEMARATEILVANSLPPPRSQGIIDTFPGGGMIPSAVEEQMRKLAAEQGELSTTLSSIDGVLSARVHLNIPQPSELDDKAKRPFPTASVLIKYRAEGKGDPPLSTAQVQALVSRAVEDLTAENVSVVFDKASLPGGDSPGEQFVDILGLRMSNDSVATFKGMAAVCILGFLGLAVWIALLYMRAAPPPPTRSPRTTSRAGAAPEA